MSGTHMADDGPQRDAEATARAEADAMGLGVLDAVDVGGTWTVVADDEAPATPDDAPATFATPEDELATPAERPRRWLLWAGVTAAALVLVLAVAISQVLPGPNRAGVPPAPPAAVPGTTDQPGIAATPASKNATTRMPKALVPTGQTGMTSTPGATPPPTQSTSTPGPTPTPAPPPTPTSPPLPTPLPTIDVTAVPVSPTAVPLQPPPTPLAAG
jgi:hypothetical protein